jgi:hypothetical protein
MNKEQMKLVKFGMEIAKIKKEFWFADLMKFLKGDDEEHHGSLYFCNLKPLYDKYGYENVNKILMGMEGKENE